MGVVFSAYDPELDRKVAIKLLRPSGLFSKLGTDKARSRLLREAKAMAKLSHPNVITVYDVGAHGDSIYIAMELVDGGTLSMWVDALREDDELDEILRLFVEAGKGLAAAHDAGVVHRDFKPDNVLVGGDGRVQVTDFGIAGVGENDEAPAEVAGSADVTASPSLTRTGEVLGTPVFMAPEQHFAGPTDPRTDQFAFAVALWHALYGEMPFVADNAIMLGVAKRDGELREPPDAPVPPRVRAALERALAGDPDARFPSLRALLAELAPPPGRSRAWIGFAAAAVPIAGLFLWTLLADRTPASGESAAAARSAAVAAARDCDCSLVRFSSGAAIAAIRPVPGGDGERRWAPGPSIDLGAALQPTGQYAVARGWYVVEYEAGGIRTWYGMRSHGFGVDRTVELPAPGARPGYRFVAGGEVRIGDPFGENGDQIPTSPLALEPYLIATAQTARASGGYAAPEIFSYDEALAQAAAESARLPTAAEWEWAATIGAFAMPGAPEWTATQYRDYPYVDDGRDSPLAPGDTAEVRGQYQPSWRWPGRRIGGARVRLARNPAPIAMGSLQLGTEAEPNELRRLGAYVARWLRSGDHSMLSIRGANCLRYLSALNELGASRRVAFLRGDEPGCALGVIADPPATPDPSWRPLPQITTDTKIEILDTVTYDGADPTPASRRILESIADSLEGNPSIRRMQVEVTVPANHPHPDHRRLSQQRAEAVRAKLIELGVAGARLLAKGRGDRTPIPCLENPPPAERTAEQAGALLSAGSNLKICGQVPESEPAAESLTEFMILERTTDGGESE